MGAESRIEALADVPSCPFAKQPRTGSLPRSMAAWFTADLLGVRFERVTT